MKAPVQPPGFALLLLRRFGARSYRESLAGDLIEACGRGASRIWVWREVSVAIASAWLARLSLAGWLSVLKAAVLAVGMVMLGAATFSWAASLGDESALSRER